MLTKRASKTVTKKSRTKPPIDLGVALIAAFLTNERVNQTLLDMLDPKIWRLMPPCSKRRNIATSFAHIHNARCMRIKMCKGTVPESLERGEVTIVEARKALAQSAVAMADLIRRSLDTDGHVRDYRPDVVSMVCSAINHEAHHRGQIAHWARELGSPLSPEQQLLLWNWPKLRSEV
jgi:uncharacterized damage-inducible protein DinB